MFAEESKFTGAILTKLFSKIRCFGGVAAICQSERERAATGDFGRNPADGFRIERMQGAGLTAASGGFNRDELL